MYEGGNVDEKSKVFVSANVFAAIDRVRNGSQYRRCANDGNTVSVNFDDVASLRNLNEQYCDHLGQATEKEFMAEEGIASADATVAYDEGTGQYSVELSIETNGEVSEEQIELYKSILSKTYAEAALVVDGEVM